MQETLYLCGLTGSRTIRNDLQKTRSALAPKRKVVGSNPARNGDAAGDFAIKAGSGGIPLFRKLFLLTEKDVC